MARIRSVHPGLFTDEAFMGLCPHAAILLIGLWTEADDHGIFEWKPLTLKARLLPVASVDLPALLEELLAGNLIQKFTEEGKPYGALRNFRKYQRPQKPHYLYPLPDGLVIYVGLSTTALVVVSDEYATAPVILPQREDGGGRMKEEAPPAGSDEPLGVSAPAKVSKKSQKTTFPEGWEPDERDMAFARSRGMDDARIERAAARFRANKLGKPGKYDWHLTWEAWILDDCARDRIRPPSTEAISPKSVFVAQDDPAFGALKAKFCEAKGKPPPIGQGGWYFDKSWLSAETH